MTVPDRAIIVVGASGHGRVVADVAMTAGYRVLGFVDDAPVASPLHDVPVLGALADLRALLREQHFHLAMGIGDNGIREKLVVDLRSGGFAFASIIAPSAVVSRYAVLGAGTVVMHNVVVNAGAVVGAHVILNTGSVVEHDCRVRDYAHLSPGVCLSGGVRVGHGVHLGTGASVIPGRHIGDWAVVGAGAVVTRDVGANVTAVGVPARVIKEAQKEPM